MPEGSRFSLDEMETFEGERSVLPVTMPVLIETQSMFVVATEVAPIRPSGKMTDERRAAIAGAEMRFGKRRNGSVSALERIFKRLRYHCKQFRAAAFVSDMKHIYGSQPRRYFGDGVPHIKISSRRKRDQTNPLKFINLTNAMIRDLTGRMRRESWLASKKLKYLRFQMCVFTAFRNFIRRKTNRHPETPAMVLGFLPRPIAFAELLTWRQDWRANSIHPLTNESATVEDVRSGRHQVA